MSRSLDIVFAGTPAFAAASLRALLSSRHRIVAVYTQPDRPAGRGRRLTASPVKALALEHALAVYQPASLRDAAEQERLRNLNADLMVVVAYGLMLPREVLAGPRLGCINVHASLLPRWRGAAPIQRAIAAGDEESGVSIMQMEEGLDTGPVLLVRRCPIRPEDTAGSLHDRLAELGAAALVEAVDALAGAGLAAQPQDDAAACYAAKLDKGEAQLDWTRPAAELERQVRAFNPWPVTYTTLADGARLRIWCAQAVAGDGAAHPVPGTVIAAGRDGIDVACGAGVLRLLQLQLPGRRAMASREFLNAHPLQAGMRLGE